jgi:prephenate dehydratase/chorismate mutase/prephenate dehydratase
MGLSEIRKSIDFLDSEILKLLNRRMDLVLTAKKFKDTIQDSEREKEVLSSIRMNSTDLISPDFIESIYREIIRESKKVQEKDLELIAFQGEHGAYGEVASKAWKGNLIPIPCKEFRDVFTGVGPGL